MLDRKKTTAFLSKLTELRLSDKNNYWGREVCFDYGTQEVRRIDYLQFCPEGTLSIDSLEKGVYRGYEIKSCKADFNSGFGKNFICEYNYMVMTMWTYKDLIESGELDELPIYVGILIAVPDKKGSTNKEILLEEFDKPSLLPKDCDTSGWKLAPIRNSLKTYRKKPTLEMMFCLMRSRTVSFQKI